MLTAHGLLPYRDFAYLQTPLQPLLFAPVAWAAGAWTWPALRLANGACAALALFCTWRAARRVAPPRVALAAAGLFACCDILLFSAGTARNDALPAACLAGAVWLAVRAEQEGAGRARAALTGLLLAAATAAKISYALPAAAYALWALTHRGHRPGFVALGAAPMVALVAWIAALAPTGFVFGVFTFPAQAPVDFYADRPWKLSLAAKLLDTLKFLALGPALLALGVGSRRPGLLRWLVIAGLVAALLPTPTWRQYLLPVLPPLFVLLAAAWAARAPSRPVSRLAAAFALIGLAPTAIALAGGAPGMVTAMRQGQALRRAMDRAGVAGPVATLSPQVLPATGRLPDARFATGPFYFRSRRLRVDETRLHLIAQRALPCAPLPAILVGGEAAWTSGDPRLDRALEAVAQTRGYRRIAVPGTPYRLYVR